MNRAVRRIALLVAGLLAIAVAAALTVPALVSTDGLRRAVAVELAGLTGQPVTIGGRATLRLLPWPEVSVTDVQIGTEAEDTRLADARRLDARLALLPLVAGRVEVAGLVLSDARLRLEVDAQGRSNWRSGGSILSVLVSDPDQGGGPRLGDVAIRGGVVVYRDQQANRRTELTDVDLSIAWPGAAARLTGQGRFRLRGEEFRLTASLDRPAALFRRDISPFELSLDTGAIRAQVSGNALAAREIQLEGRLTFNSPSVRRLAGWLVPEVQNTPDVGPVTGVARLRIVDRMLALDEARLTIDRARGEGALAFTFDRTRTAVQGTMDFDALDIRPFLQTQIPLNLPDAPAPGTPAGQAAPERVGAIDMDLRVSAGTLNLGRALVRNAAVSLLSRDGRIEVGIGDGQIYGGRMSGRLITEARPSGGIRTRAQVTLASVRLEDALRELFGFVRLAGTGNLGVTLTAEGMNQREILGGLRGEATLRLAQGSLAGIDLAALMRRAERNPVEAFLDARGGRTPIESATATFRIAEGQASTEDAVMRGQGYQVTLRGQFDGLRRTVALTGVLSGAQAEAGRPPLELPFVIRGPVTDPVIVPNPEGIVRRPAPQPAPAAPAPVPAPPPAPPNGAPDQPVQGQRAP